MVFSCKIFSLCCGAECLFHVVQGAIPEVYLDSAAAVPAGEMAVHILDYLYMKLNEVCLVQGGEVKEKFFFTYIGYIQLWLYGYI